jgi:hypothetical protein
MVLSTETSYIVIPFSSSSTNRTYISGLFFYLYRIFYAPVQITTFVLQMATHKASPASSPTHAFVAGGGSDRYKCEAITFVPVVATDRYKCENICTRSCYGPIQVCNGYPPPRPGPPPHSSSSSLQLELPLPQWCPREFLPDLRRFLHDLTH